MVLFDDIKIAYTDKSDKDLSRAYFLFRVISQPFITKILTSFLRIAISSHIRVQMSQELVRLINLIHWNMFSIHHRSLSTPSRATLQDHTA